MEEGGGEELDDAGEPISEVTANPTALIHQVSLAMVDLAAGLELRQNPKKATSARH